MKYNLAGNITNDTGAQLELSADTLSNLVDGNIEDTVITVSGGGSIYLICDLDNRYNLDSIEYRHSPGGSVSISVSESQDFWVDVAHTTTVWGSLLDLGSSTLNPRWVRIQHSVTTGEVDIYEIILYNGDGNILFGTDGTFDSYGMDTAGVTVQRVDVYNPTDIERDINVFVENDTTTVADNLLKVGATESTLYSKREIGLNIPTHFGWDSGQHSGTVSVGNSLVVSGTLASGTYYSPVLDVSTYSDYRFFWEYLSSGFRSITFGDHNSDDCFGVRRFSIPPSGTWVSGELAGEADIYWSISSGQLQFESVPNDTILEFRDWDYLQFAVTITGTAIIFSAGVEAPVVVQNVQPNSYKDLYITALSGTTSGKTANLMCWYTE